MCLGYKQWMYNKLLCSHYRKCLNTHPNNPLRHENLGKNYNKVRAKLYCIIAKMTFYCQPEHKGVQYKSMIFILYVLLVLFSLIDIFWYACLFTLNDEIVLYQRTKWYHKINVVFETPLTEINVVFEWYDRTKWYHMINVVFETPLPPLTE